MAWIKRGEVAVVVTGSSFAIITSRKVGEGLQKALAVLLSSQVGIPLIKDRQAIIDDLGAALGDAFKAKPQRASLQAVCQIDGCGCDGTVHA